MESEKRGNFPCVAKTDRAFMPLFLLGEECWADPIFPGPSPAHMKGRKLLIIMLQTLLYTSLPLFFNSTLQS